MSNSQRLDQQFQVRAATVSNMNNLHPYFFFYENVKNIFIAMLFVAPFRNLARDKTRPLGVFYFGHSTNIMSVVTRLGIGKDDIPLLSTNFELMSHRKWRVSFIDPFASNVIAVFYRCRDGNKAMILLNEHAIPFGKDKCRLCPWEPIETQFDPIISNNKTCNLDMCKNSGTFQSMNLLIVVFVFTCSTLVKHIYF